MATPSMQIGLFSGADCTTPSALVERGVEAEARGFASLWVPQTPFFDALTALAAVALRTSTIELGTGVVPVQTRHPATMAQQALTVAELAGDRVCLAVGATHAMVSEGWWGVPYKGIVDVVAEYIDIVRALLVDRTVDHVGPNYTARVTYPPGGATPSLVLAALGPKMLEIAGASCAGTFTWMTGPHTLATRTIEPLRSAATLAGRGAPRVIAGLPICLTADVAAARAFIEPRMAFSANMPSYKRALEWEGVASPVDIALIGDEGELRRRLDALEAVGVTDFCANLVGPDDGRDATLAFLGELARERSTR
ncbi:MAG: TIGR03564 family F420-dependent LLM class oxidoreductase [Actinobacteria bacterium]|nr:TIGR03564 family F420-dependent LLM class oxidoreductase [Actinomycetota bacterium]